MILYVTSASFWNRNICVLKFGISKKDLLFYELSVKKVITLFFDNVLHYQQVYLLKKKKRTYFALLTSCIIVLLTLATLNPLV